MYNDTRITVRGYVGSAPYFYSNDDGSYTTIVSVGVTSRSWNRQEKKICDNQTMWYSVRCYGDLACNVSACLDKGSPVIVRGRLELRAWQDKDGNAVTRNVIVADCVGVDLNTGTAQFERVRSTHGGGQGDVGAGVGDVDDVVPLVVDDNDVLAPF